MKKLVRTNLTNTADRRGTNDLNIQFYSHDKNNAGFEFVVKNETDLSKYTPKVLFKFRDSNSTWQANGTVEGNVVKVNFNTDLIARCEEVLGFLFLDSDSDSLDVFKFKFNVVLSEIDKGEVANRQIKHVNNIGELELVTRSQLKDELSKLQINGVDLSEYLTTRVAEETYVKKSEIPQAYNDSALSERVTALENRQSTGGAVTSATSSEIRGTGMPNGVVEAPIGTTYIDTAKTNGALKWIKTTDGGTTGWKVIEGDTGWITIFQGKVWRDFINRLMIRRINNTVNVVFEGLGDAEGIFFDKTAHPYNLDLVNVKVVDGFKPISRITLPTLNYASFYDEDHLFTVGTITFDVIDGMFKITLFSEQDRVNRMSNGLANINFNYVTYEEWPVQLL